MKMNLFIDEQYIPKNDGSREILEKFKNYTLDTELILNIFPDIHYKKGSLSVNGLMTISDYILPEMLGVENCGYSFGTLPDIDHNQAIELFGKVSKKLKDYNFKENFDKDEVKELFFSKAHVAIQKDQNLASYLNVQDDFQSIKNFFNPFLSDKILKSGSKSLGTLGGGNHFFELHKVEEAEETSFKNGQLIFILHTDSIIVGNYIQLLFSNLTELNYLDPIRRLRAKLIYRIFQLNLILPSLHLLRDYKNLRKIFFKSTSGRGIHHNSPTGRFLFKHFFIASMFGEINREIIISLLEKELNDLGIQKGITLLGSHSHDSVNIESYKGSQKIIQRNGVQKIGKDNFCILPGALGINSHILKNPNNHESLHSCNHGLGRIHDKHIAREKFNDVETSEFLKEVGVKIFKIGTGRLNEQFYKSFKDLDEVLYQMNKYKLGHSIAKLSPLCSIKG